MTNALVQNAAEFNAQMERFLRNVVPERAHRIQTAVGLEALKRVVLKTPVDTGRARGNWDVSIDSPVDSASEATDKSGSATVGKGSATISGAPPYSLIWLSNNVPHILVLENGGFKPANPVNSPEANKRRKWSRKPPRRQHALDVTGDEGGPLVRDGHSLQAPHGMLAVTIQELTVIFGSGDRLRDSAGRFL